MARLAVFAIAAAVLGFTSGVTPAPPPAGSPGTAPAAFGELRDDAMARLVTTDRYTATPTTLAAAQAAGDRRISPPPEDFDAPPAPAAPPPSALTAASSSGRTGGVWAVIIGIDDYPGSRSDLRASVNDANDMDAALAAYGVPGDRRLLIRNTQATAGTIRASMQWLVDRASAEATAVFFYAGHVRKLRSGQEAIVAADGRLVRDVEMGLALRDLAAGRTWIAMASCYGGGFTEVLAPGRILTGAADATSLAYENSRYGRSYFVEYMVRRAMIHGQAAGSIEQSFAWAVDALGRDHPDRMPHQQDWLDGELRLGSPPPPSAPSSAPPPPPDGGGGEQPSDPQPKNPSQPPEDDDPCLITLGSVLACDDE